MSKEGIFWTKPGTTESNYDKAPPYPSYNAIAVVVEQFTSQYVTREMASAFWQRYRAATQEIAQSYNDMAAQRRELAKKIAELETELAKWKGQQRKGRRPDRKIQAMHEEIRTMKDTGISNREIARRLGISEGTVRRVLNEVCFARH